MIFSNVFFIVDVSVETGLGQPCGYLANFLMLFKMMENPQKMCWRLNYEYTILILIFVYYQPKRIKKQVYIQMYYLLYMLIYIF